MDMEQFKIDIIKGFHRGGDRTAQAIGGDFALEHLSGEAGELLGLDAQLAAQRDADADDPTRREAQERFDILLKRYWRAIVEDHAKVSFTRGVLQLSLAVLPFFGSARDAETRLRDMLGRVPREFPLMLIPSRINSLVDGDTLFRRLVGSAAMEQLDMLDLSLLRLEPHFIQALAESRHTGRLRWLSLNHSHTGTAGAEALAQSAGFSHLMALFLVDSEIRDAGVAALAGSTHLPLQILNLDGNRLSNASAQALANTALPLEWLSLHENPRINAIGIQALAGSTQMTRLASLYVDNPTSFLDAYTRALRAFINDRDAHAMPLPALAEVNGLPLDKEVTALQAQARTAAGERAEAPKPKEAERGPEEEPDTQAVAESYRAFVERAQRRRDGIE